MENIGGVIRRRASDQDGKKPAAKKPHLPGIQPPERHAEKYIHTADHALAAEMSAFFGERRKFAVYLGIIRRMGAARARAIFSSIKSDDAQIRSPRKFFMWLSKSEGKKTKIPPVPKAPKKRRAAGRQLDFKAFLG